MNTLFANENIKNKNKNKKIRVYTIVDFPLEGETTGKYKGKTPKAAAAKAFNRLCKEYTIKTVWVHLIILNFILKRLEIQKIKHIDFMEQDQNFINRFL